MIDRRAFLKSLAGLTTGIILSSSSSEGQEVKPSKDRLGTLLPLRKFDSCYNVGCGWLAHW